MRASPAPGFVPPRTQGDGAAPPSMARVVGKAPSAAVVAALAPTGTLRAAINMSNFLLVTDKTPEGLPIGVSASLAAHVAARLGVPLKLLPYANPPALCDAAGPGESEWDIGNIGADPLRGEFINFTAPYCEIESTVLLTPGSAVHSFADLDKPGTRIVTAKGGAYSLWLERNVRHATLVQETGAAVRERFISEGLDAMAGLRPALVKDELLSDGYTLMPGHYGMVEQATGVPKAKGQEAFAWLREWIEEVKENGLVPAPADVYCLSVSLCVSFSVTLCVCLSLCVRLSLSLSVSLSLCASLSLRVSLCVSVLHMHWLEQVEGLVNEFGVQGGLLVAPAAAKL